MKYSETLTYIAERRQQNKTHLDKGFYEISDLYDAIGKIRKNSADEQESTKHTYVAEIAGWKIVLRMIFTSKGLYKLEVKSPKDYFDSYSDWGNIPNELLNHLIYIKNILREYLEDKIDWPFPICQVGTSAEL